jgi:hypothetical protein
MYESSEEYGGSRRITEARNTDDQCRDAESACSIESPGGSGTSETLTPISSNLEGYRDLAASKYRLTVFPTLSVA